MPRKVHFRPLKNRHLRALASLRFGIILMVSLAVVSIAGTLLPYEKSLKTVYHTWWFRLFFLLLAVNLALCTYQHLAGKVAAWFRPRFQRESEFYQRGKMRYRFDCEFDPQEMVGLLRRHRFKAFRDGEYFYARRGSLGMLGAPLAHVGFVLVLTAGFATAFVAFEGRVRLNEGESTSVMVVPGTNPSTRPLGFTMRCLDFQTGTYARTHIPSHFVSILEITDNGKRFTESVEVNKALKYKGLKFHQSSYGEVTGQARYRLSLTDRATSRAIAVVADIDSTAPIEGTSYSLRLARGMGGLRYDLVEGSKVVASDFLGPRPMDMEVMAVRFVPDFLITDGEVVSRSEQMNNPALQIAWLREGQHVGHTWLFGRTELRGFTHGGQEPVRLELERVDATSGSKQVDQSRAREQAVFTLAAYDKTSGAFLGRFKLALGNKIRLGELPLPAFHLQPPASGLSPPLMVRLVGTEPMYWTELAVSRNPVIAVIYFGSILTCLAICLALCTQRVAVWVWCDRPGGRIWMAVHYDRERAQPTGSVVRLMKALQGEG